VDISFKDDVIIVLLCFRGLKGDIGNTVSSCYRLNFPLPSYCFSSLILCYKNIKIPTKFFFNIAAAISELDGSNGAFFEVTALPIGPGSSSSPAMLIG
jgi:hypothetical protein